MKNTCGNTTALEDYLKIIFKLEEQIASHKGVSTTEIAQRLNISKASVSNMLKKLAEQDYILYVPYYGVNLTDQGQRIALNMIRRHRILEQFLVERLGYGWDEVDAEAEVLEHAVSDKLTNRMWHDLGCPTQDPHGSPIPNENGEMMEQNWLSITTSELEEEVMIQRIQNRSPEELRYLKSIGLIKGARLHVIAKAPFNGPLSVKINGIVQAIDHRIALSILVSKTEF